jgi:hypothetical protein
MNLRKFVQAIKIQTSDAAVDGTIGCLTKPPGHKPSEHLVKLSHWYKQLNSTDQEMLGQALREAAEMAIFEFFCVLDGVSVIEDTPEKGELELYYTQGTQQVRLNDPYGEELHNLFNRLCSEAPQISSKVPELSPYESGEAQELKPKMILGDNMDMHHVPDKYASIQLSKGYDPRTGLAIVLPKVEHRQIPPQ